MSPIKNFTITCDALNKEGTFSEGDTITGSVSFTLTKETKVKGLVVKAKGDANVQWTEGSKEDSTVYSAHRRYFKVKECLIPENAKGTVLPKGVHHFKFRCKIPQGDIPSSFRGNYGKIVYMLFCPQSDSVAKKMGGFSKGQVRLFVDVDRKVCSPGDTLHVVAKICNSSSKKMKPKFNLYQKIVYRAEGSTRTEDKSLYKIVGETIRENSEETVSCQVKIPDDIILINCEILSIEHYLKVYLDISFAFDPELVFPLVIVPCSFTALHPDEAMDPYPAGAAGGPFLSTS